MHVFISRKGNFLSHQFQFYEIMQMQIFVIYHCSLSSMSITITMSWYVACLFFVYFYNKCLHVLWKEYFNTAWNVPNIFLRRFIAYLRLISFNYHVWWIPDKNIVLAFVSLNPCKFQAASHKIEILCFSLCAEIVWIQ